MTFKRSAVAAAAVLLQATAAWNVELPPCLSPYQPFVYSGCFQDGAPGQPPALIFRSPQSSDNMTVEACTAECKGNGFRYAGLEYYGQCFCGDTVNGAQISESSCTFPCNGDKSETCGGNSILSVWQDPTFPTTPATIGDYQEAGCYSDNSPNGRTLSWSAQVDTATFTVESCLTACEAEGFPLAGVEFGQECWCGNVLANDTSKIADSQCNKPCKGNTAETCGGSGALNLYIATDLESLEPCGFTSSSAPPPPPTSTSTPPPPPPPTTTSTPPPPPPPTTTSTPPPPPPPTTTSTPPPPPPTTTSTPPPPPPTTTTTPPPPPPHTTTTSSAPLCTTTVVTPPTCEYKCGSWCLPGLPDWGNQGDCQKSYATCAASVAVCFKSAGFPGALGCFDFGVWCSNINNYCSTSCSSKYGSCSKSGCWGHYPPSGGSPGTTSTKVYPCPATTTAKPPVTTTKPTTSCPPTPTNICTQPSNSYYGYGPGNPVGGIPLPLVSCNDKYSDWLGKPFKLYNNQDSSACPSYTRPQCGSACSEACEEQYTQCIAVYQKGCQAGSSGRYKRTNDLEARNFAGGNSFTSNCGYGNNSPSQAQLKCKQQYSDCLSVNKNVNPNGHCTTWGW